MRFKTNFVYIMTNRSGTPYVGVTSDLLNRIEQHRWGDVYGFTSRYRVDRLVYFEQTNDVWTALNREKEIKGWLRRKKIALIAAANPTWRDLSEGWSPPFAALAIREPSSNCHSERSEESSAPVRTGVRLN